MNEPAQDPWREMLEPPIGGLARLVDAIESPHSRHAWRQPSFALAGVGAMAAVAATFGLSLHQRLNSS